MSRLINQKHIQSARIGMRASLCTAILGALTMVGCNLQELTQQAGTTTWLSVATGGTGGVYYPYGGGIAKGISDKLDYV